MLNRYPPPCSFSSSSPLLCEMRIDELRARKFSVLFVSRCEWRGGDRDCGEASVLVLGAGAQLVVVVNVLDVAEGSGSARGAEATD